MMSGSGGPSPAASDCAAAATTAAAASLLSGTGSCFALFHPTMHQRRRGGRADRQFFLSPLSNRCNRSSVWRNGGKSVRSSRSCRRSSEALLSLAVMITRLLAARTLAWRAAPSLGRAMMASKERPKMPPLSSAASDGRIAFSSVEEYLQQDIGRRLPPPVLDGHQLDDDAYGVPGYEIDIAYEQEELRKHESLVQEQTTTKSPNTEAPAERRRQLAMFPSVEAVAAMPVVDAPSETHSPPPPPGGARFDDEFLAKAASGYGSTTTLDVLEKDLEQLQQQIYERNRGIEFNLNSPAKVAQVLFGPMGGSTEKSVLEAKAAGGDRMADLILQYRSLKHRIDRLRRRRDDERTGRRVSSPSAVAAAGSSKKDEFGSDPLMLVDASSYIFRAYYSMPPIHRAVDGMPTGAVLGFCNMLNKLTLTKMLNGETPRLVLVFDAPGKTFRHEIYRDYKSHRPEAPVDLIPQFALVRQAARAYGICQVEAPGFEADDVIATLCRMARDEGLDVNIFSGDKDLMQLVCDRQAAAEGGGAVQMIDPATMARCTSENVIEKWGVPPSQLGDVLALAGDAADNVPGVPGIGPKIAAQLMQEYGTLENLLQNADGVKQKARRSKLVEFRDQARLSRVLVELRDDLSLDRMTFPAGAERASDLRMESMDEDRILAFYEEMGFQEIRRRFEASLLKRRGGPTSRRRRSAVGSAGQRRPRATIPRPEDYVDVPF